MTTPTSSPWSDKNPVRSAMPLVADATCDVCVVGGGIAGLTTAYLLADEGKSVALLDSKQAVGGGETEYTTAHLAWVLDDRFARLASIRGDEVAKAAADSHRAAIDLIGEIVARDPSTKLAAQKAMQTPRNHVLFFHANYVFPAWSKKLSKQYAIGKHIFYALN